MAYEVVHASRAAAATARSGVAGYLYNHGGINNQKMAVVALMLSAIERRMAVSLPYIYIRDQTTEDEYLTAFGNVFDMQCVHDFARRANLTIDDTLPGGARDGWDYFRAFGTRLADQVDPVSTGIILDAVASLQPRIAATSLFQQLKTFVFSSLNIETVIQLRIENDWVVHTRELRPTLGDAEDYDIGFLEILAKLRRSFPVLGLVYVTADERSMPASKDEIRGVARSRFGLDLVWKSDLMDQAQIAALNPLDLSLIDFEIARLAPRFIGSSYSTFTNMLCLEKFAATRQPVRGHFIYTHPADVVMERQDNGFAVSARRAVQRIRGDGTSAGAVER
jgi:hypothetical protein